MAFEKKPNSGALFRNDKREGDNQPNAKGDCIIDGAEYWVSAWTNTAKDGAKYQSLKFTRKDEEKKTSEPITPLNVDEIDGDIPF